MCNFYFKFFGALTVVPSQRLPPLVIAEALQDFVSNRYKIRRLHLIVVKAVTDQMKHLTNTPEMQRQIPMMPPSGKVPPRCRRFIYGYALGHSEFPCYTTEPSSDGHKTMLSGPENQVPLFCLWCFSLCSHLQTHGQLMAKPLSKNP